jgi:PAS domain S-box-containing protein
MNRIRNNSQFWTQIAGLVLVAIAYWVVVRIGLLFVAQPEGVASIWPASGLALAVLLLNPKSEWSKLLAVIFVTNAAGNWSGGNSLPVSLGFALANILEALLGAWVLTWLCKSKITFGRTMEIFALFGVAIISNAITALLGAATAALAFGAPFMNTWLVWWISDGLGMLLVTPLIVTWAVSQNMFQSASPRRLVEAVFLVITLTAFSWLLFGNFTVAEEPVLRNYMLFPILIWLAFRYSPRGMASALTLLAAIAIWNTLQGHGIFGFADQSVTQHLVSVQMLLCVTSFTGYLLSAIVTEQKLGMEKLRESEDKFKYVFENSAVGKSLTLPSGEINVNRAMCGMLGYSEEELRHRKWQEITHPEDVEVTQNAMNVVMSGEKESIRFLKRYIHKDGSIVWTDVSSAIRREPDGKPLYFITSIIDITERKHAEETLRQSEEKFSKAFQTSPYAITITRVEDGRFIEVNNAFTSITGISREEALSDSSIGLKLWVNEEDRRHVVSALRAGESVMGWEFLFRRKNGEVLTGLFSAQIIQLNLDACIISSINNITERKQAEDALRESEKKYQALTEISPVGIFRTDAQGNTTYVNPRWSRISGLSADEALGDGWLRAVHPEDREKLSDGWKKAASAQTASVREYRFVCPDGSVTWVLGQSTPERNIEGQVVGYVGTITDITERKQAEEALRESEEKWHSLVSASPDYIALHDRNGRYLFLNRYAEGFTEKDVIGNSIFEYLAPEFKDLYGKKMEECLSTLTTQKFEYSAMGDHGIFKIYEQYLVPITNAKKEIEILAIARDITERKRIEQQLANYTEKLEVMVDERTRELREAQERVVRQEKLAVLGQLAGGVGHELRNPLGVINNAVYFLKLIQPQADEKIKEYLNLIEKETHTAEMIITDLLGFARVQSVEREAVSVSDLIHQTLERFPAPPTVEVTLEIPADLPRVHVDLRQMTQVLGNLTINACQAMKDGGHLTISAVPQNDFIAIAVKDTGVGIPPGNMSKLFEPLFTTKTKGIGLGLAVSKKLIEANGGRIDVGSEAGKGSTFTFWLPRYSLPN